MDVGRPKKNNYPEHMLADKRRGGFLVRNPLTRKERRFDDEALARAAAKLIAEAVKDEREQLMLETGAPTIANLVVRWIRDAVPLKPWDTGTRDAMLAKARRIQRELGARMIARTDCMFIEDWLGEFCRTADTFNDWRYVFVLLWRFAISRRLADYNEPERIEKRSTSKKIEANRKVRQPLDVDGFKLIHAQAPQYLQVAMELSLITLQARTEVCSMQHAHFRDGYVFVIRDKVSGDSDMAFIKIELSDELRELQERAKRIVEAPRRAKREPMPVVSPYLVHRHPEHKRREWLNGKPHWTFVEPAYLTKRFAEVRDGIEQFSSIEPAGARPTFHEIRGLGARLLEQKGVPKTQITALMTHSNPRTTKIYLDGGAKALSDGDYHPVRSALSAREILK